MVCICTENQDQARFRPSAPQEVSILPECSFLRIPALPFHRCTAPVKLPTWHCPQSGLCPTGLRWLGAWWEHLGSQPPTLLTGLVKIDKSGGISPMSQSPLYLLIPCKPPICSLCPWNCLLCTSGTETGQSARTSGIGKLRQIVKWPTVYSHQVNHKILFFSKLRTLKSK